MTTTTFDTLAYSKVLQEAGIPQNHAEALARAQKLAIDEILAIKEVATQADIPALKTGLNVTGMKFSNGWLAQWWRKLHSLWLSSPFSNNFCS